MICKLNKKNYESHLSSELKTLPLNLRNKVRGILSAPDEEKSLILLNKLRPRISSSDLLRIENILRDWNLLGKESIVPSFFPASSQTTNNYPRLSEISFETQIQYLENSIKLNREKLLSFFNAISHLNNALITKKTIEIDDLVNKIFDQYGYSYLLLKKCLLLKDEKIESVNIFLEQCYLNKPVGRLLIQCYQPEQDYLNMKRSISRYTNRISHDQYTIDILKSSFQPHVSVLEELNKLVLSLLQSSLIDAVIIAFINKKLIDKKHTLLHDFFKNLASIFINANDVVTYYLLSNKKGSKELEEIDDYEMLFYQQSSAWLEYEFIHDYRLFVDIFYSEESYDNFLKNVSHGINIHSWLNSTSVADLVNSKEMINHGISQLTKLENLGLVTRSAAFNYLLYCKTDEEGFLTEANLYKLMECTRDLDRIINEDDVEHFAQTVSSDEARLILYFLIAKKSKKNTLDYETRSQLQIIIKEKYHGSLLDFITSIGEKSLTVAQYIYELSNEQFIARLSHIISTASEITETRAALHKWMWQKTGQKEYLDRHKTMLIDHQINKVRGELDDYRIYADSTKFLQWVQDDLSNDMNSLITSYYANLQYDTEDDYQGIIELFNKAYYTFCTDKTFGIAAYLGRRIRHGTYRGHMMSLIKNLTEEYNDFLNSPPVKDKWSKWEENYTQHVQTILGKYLYIESSEKKMGLLKPRIEGQNKLEIAKNIAEKFLHEYLERNQPMMAWLMIIECCWRVLEVDLRIINKFLENQKQQLMFVECLDEMKGVTQSSSEYIDFNRKTRFLVGEKIKMVSSWFKKPASVSPQASLVLLFDAVISEVRETNDVSLGVKDQDEQDIILMGGDYHIIYDALYVLIQNAAKHGKDGNILRNFKMIEHPNEVTQLEITITSEIKDNDCEKCISKSLLIQSDDSIQTAHLHENNSGIKKLHQLKTTNSNFNVKLECKNRQVIAKIFYKLVFTNEYPNY